MFAKREFRGGDCRRARIVKSIEMRRRYNREYMRRWRGDPRHRQREVETRLRAYLKQKMQRATSERRLYINRCGQAVCGFCWRRPPVRMAERLRISEAARSGYVRVLIPCCEEC
jgi:hypothetical protein